MPLVEFMKHYSREKRRADIPDFIRGSADFFNAADNTYVGWVADNRDWYLPESVTVLTKETFTNRMLAMHAANPFQKGDPSIPGVEAETMTTEEVTAQAHADYDRIVAHCQAED